MNRLLTTSLSVMLGLAAMQALAQERGAPDREHRGDRSSEERQRDRGERGQPPPAVTEIPIATTVPPPVVAVEPAQAVAQTQLRTEAQYERGDRDSRDQGDRYRGRDADRNDGRGEDRYSERDRDDKRYGDRGRDDRRYGDRDRDDRRYGDRGRDDRRYDGRGRDDRRYDYQNYSRRDWNRNSWRRDWHAGWSGSRYRANSRYFYPRGFSARNWSIGYRLPSAYFGASYYLDYRTYGLNRPPYGTQWVRIDSNVVLVDLATGEILDILENFYY